MGGQVQARAAGLLDRSDQLTEGHRPQVILLKSTLGQTVEFYLTFGFQGLQASMRFRMSPMDARNCMHGADAYKYCAAS